MSNDITEPVAWALDDRLEGGTLAVPYPANAPTGSREVVDRIISANPAFAMTAVPLYPAAAEQHLNDYASPLERIAYWSARACRASDQGRETADASMDLDMAQDELDKAITDYTAP